MSEIILKGRLDGIQRNKLKGLFDMMYSPRELAEELGINTDQLYGVYLPLGCPEVRDEKKHILINGKLFADWYIKVYAKIKLKQDETFCKTCKQGVKIFNPKYKKKGNLSYTLSVCPVCGRNLTKITEYKRGEK